MAEENKNAAPTEEYNDDGQKNPDYVAPKIEGEDAGAGIEKKDDKEKKDGEEEVFDDTINPVKPPEIPIRQFNAQHIIARKNKQIDKLKSKLKEGDEGYVAPKEGEEEEDLPEEQPGAVEETVKKVLAPLLGKLASDAAEAEFQALVKAEPEAAKYTNHIKAYMSHEAYQNVSPVVIYHHLAFKSAQALGAKQKKAADLEAAQKRGGGGTIIDKGTGGDFPTPEEIADMSNSEFEKFDQELEKGHQKR